MRPRRVFLMMPSGAFAPPSSESQSSTSEGEAGKKDTEEHPKEELDKARVELEVATADVPLDAEAVDEVVSAAGAVRAAINPAALE